MAEVINWFFVSQQTISLNFTEGGPSFSNQDSRLGPVIEKNPFYYAILVMTSVVSISKGQACVSNFLCEYSLRAKFSAFALWSCWNCKTYAKTLVCMRLQSFLATTSEPTSCDNDFNPEASLQCNNNESVRPATVHSLNAYIKCQLQCYLWLCMWIFKAYRNHTKSVDIINFVLTLSLATHNCL